MYPGSPPTKSLGTRLGGVRLWDQDYTVNMSAVVRDHTEKMSERDASQCKMMSVRDASQCKMITVLIAEGAVIFQDKLAVQLDVPVLAHPVDRRQAVMLTNSGATPCLPLHAVQTLWCPL